MTNGSAIGVVLYVEDEENDAFFMQVAFRKAGTGDALRTVTTGQAAKDYLAGGRVYSDRALYPLPDILLLDAHLPDMTGLEVLTWVRERPEFRNLPVVMLSGFLRPHEKEQGVEAGADDFLEKPSSPLKFLELVNGLTKYNR